MNKQEIIGLILVVILGLILGVILATALVRCTRNPFVPIEEKTFEQGYEDGIIYADSIIKISKSDYKKGYEKALADKGIFEGKKK